MAAAAAKVALDVLITAADGFAMVEMLKEMLAPVSSTPQSTAVRVLLGNDIKTDTSFGGNTPGIALWDFAGRYIGHTPGTKEIVAQGAFVDVVVTPPKNGAGNIQSSYVAVTNGGDDAICVAALSITFPDGVSSGWDASSIVNCGDPNIAWSNSASPTIGNALNSGAPLAKCIWIDRNRSNGLKFQGFGLHLPSFSSVAQGLANEYRDNSDFLCKSGPRFRMYENLRTEDPILVYSPPLEFITDPNDENFGGDKDRSIIIGNPGVMAEATRRRVRREQNDRTFRSTKQDPWAPNSDGPVIDRRSVRERRKAVHTSISNSSSANGIPKSSRKPPMYNTVVVSPHEYNSARELCMSSSSFGPSFVSLTENLFCDMEDKILYHTCDGNAPLGMQSCCFDVKRNSLLPCLSQTQSNGDVKPSLANLKFLPVNVAVSTPVENITSSGMREGKVFNDVRNW